MNKIKYAHFTVPHSGTRYINHAVREASGINVVQSPSIKKWERDSRPEFIFVHIGPGYLDMIDWGIEHSEKSWMTVRSPIHTWGTQWKNMEPCLNSFDEFSYKEKLGQVRQQYMAQRELMNRHPDLYVHKVEDGLEGLSEYLELDLKEHLKTYSRESPMKKALKERDLHKMEELCYGTKFLQGFQEGITPEIREFYENLGYEIWWA